MRKLSQDPDLYHTLFLIKDMERRGMYKQQKQWMETFIHARKKWSIGKIKSLLCTWNNQTAMQKEANPIVVYTLADIQILWWWLMEKWKRKQFFASCSESTIISKCGLFAVCHVEEPVYIFFLFIDGRHDSPCSYNYKSETRSFNKIP